jgi:hypothetical protein
MPPQLHLSTVESCCIRRSCWPLATVVSCYVRRTLCWLATVVSCYVRSCNCRLATVISCYFRRSPLSSFYCGITRATFDVTLYHSSKSTRITPHVTLYHSSKLTRSTSDKTWYHSIKSTNVTSDIAWFQGSSGIILGQTSSLVDSLLWYNVTSDVAPCHNDNVVLLEVLLCMPNSLIRHSKQYDLHTNTILLEALSAGTITYLSWRGIYPIYIGYLNSIRHHSKKGT